MSVAFLDGSQATLTYPEPLDLASLGVRPSGSASIPGFGRDFLILYDGEAWAGPTLQAFEGANGGVVHLREGPPGGAPFYLTFQFGRWTVYVWDGASSTLDQSARGLWASHLAGSETEHGFLVLEAQAPLSLARAGDHAGPMLEFGSSGEGNALELTPGPCTPPQGEGVDMISGVQVSRSQSDAWWCDEEAAMIIRATGDDDFIESVAAGLKIGRGSGPA